MSFSRRDLLKRFGIGLAATTVAVAPVIITKQLTGNSLELTSNEFTIQTMFTSHIFPFKSVEPNSKIVSSHKTSILTLIGVAWMRDVNNKRVSKVMKFQSKPIKSKEDNERFKYSDYEKEFETFTQNILEWCMLNKSRFKSNTIENFITV